MDDEPRFQLLVDEISPRDGGDDGTVTFRFEVAGFPEDLIFRVPYFDAEGYDHAVGQAAGSLMRMAEAIAAEAKGLAK